MAKNGEWMASRFFVWIYLGSESGEGKPISWDTWATNDPNDKPSCRVVIGYWC